MDAAKGCTCFPCNTVLVYFYWYVCKNTDHCLQSCNRSISSAFWQISQMSHALCRARDWKRKGNYIENYKIQVVVNFWAQSLEHCCLECFRSLAILFWTSSQICQFLPSQTATELEQNGVCWFQTEAIFFSQFRHPGCKHACFLRLANRQSPWCENMATDCLWTISWAA